MRIQHNIPAMNSYRNYNNNANALSKNLEKLSSGYRINRAGDDAAGLAISEKMRAQITGLDAAQKNVQDGISLVKTAEGALQEVQDMMNRMVYLATQSANGTYDNEVDRANLQKEVAALKEEINRIADSSNFNGQKLLDGSLATTQLSEVPVEFNTVSATAGITINEATAGGGTKGEFTIDLSKALSEGDAITIAGKTGEDVAFTGNVFTFSNLDSNASSAVHFSGDTAEEQAANLATKLGVHSQIGTNFDISVDGTKITLTAKEEGTDTPPMITSAGVTTDRNVTATITDTGAAGTANSGGTASKQAIELFGGTGINAGALQVGDELTFKFKDNVGNDLEATVKVDASMISTDAATSTAAIVEALKEAKFKDLDSTTGVDESKLTVGELFTVTANTAKDGTTAAYGSVYIEGTAGALGAGYGSATGVQVNRGGMITDIAVVAGGTASTAASAGAASTIEIADPTVNFSAGDKVTFKGTLRDGSEFEIELVAGTDFEIDTGATAAVETMKNLTAALTSDKVSVKVTDAEGNESTLTGKDLFGDKGEFTATYGTNKLTLTSKYKGTENTINAEIAALDAAETNLSKVLAKPQTAAQSSFTVGEGLEYGAAVKVGDVTYEIVADARDTTNRSNTAIVVDDLTDTAGIAAKLAEAIGKDQADYNVSVSGDTVSLASKKIGSDQVALEVTAPYGDEVTTASFKFDADVVEEGSVFKFNDNTYEFVKAGEKATTAGAIAIEVKDFDAATAKELGDAFADVAKNGIVSVADDGTVTLKGTEGKDGTISKPTISFGQNLTLQIGDTADSYNQLKVDISDMHVDALGIGGIDISTLEGAQKAIEEIKTAINSVSSQRGDLGAIQNRLEHTANNLSVMEENIQNAESAIRDTDIADEMTQYTKNNILLQSAQAMLAQANQMPQGVLQLLQ